MARLIFDGPITLEQAEELAHWFEGSGEQQACDWFECQDCEFESPMSDVQAKNWLVIDKKNQTVTMKVK